MKPSIEQIAVWILEALEEERQREPDWVKCRPASQVLGPLKEKYGLDDRDISNALRFCLERDYVEVLNRADGQAIRLTDEGVRMFARIQQNRFEEEQTKLKEGEKKKRREQFATFDHGELSKMNATELAGWQTQFEQDDPQWKVAEHEWQLRSNKGARKIALLAICISILSLLLTAGFNLYDRLHHPPDNRMLVTLTVRNSGKAEIGVQPLCSFALTESAAGMTMAHPAVMARLFPVHLQPGENGLLIPAGMSRDFQINISDDFRNEFENGAGRLDISGGLTTGKPYAVSVPFYKGGMTGTVDFQ